MKLGLLGLCGLAVLGGLAVGASGLRTDVVSGLLHGDEVLTLLRLPRVLLSLAVGGCLAVAGICMQTVLRNDLADPYVLGMAGGASAGAVASLALRPGWPPGPAAAVGAALATVIVGGLERGRHDPARLILGGVAVGAVLASVTGLVLVLAPGEHLLRSATTWLFGGFGTPGLGSALLPASALALALVLLWRRAERLDRFLLGDDAAQALGADPRGVRRLALVAGVALTALAVAAGGLIGFVGLIAPHAARRLVGARHRQILPVAALLGALVVTVADTTARTAFAPREVPLGLLTALLGGPFFLLLLRRA